MDIANYYDLVGTEQEIEWLRSLPDTRESVDILLDYISNVVSVEAYLLFLEWTDMLSIDTIEALSITSDDITFVVDEIFKNLDKEFIKYNFTNSTFNTSVLDMFEDRGCSIADI